MVKRANIYKRLAILALAAATLPGNAGAEDIDNTVHFIGHYDFAWNGIHLGSLALGIDEDGATYHIQLHTQSEGIVNLFTKHSDDTEVTGGHDGGHYRPAHYDSHYKTKNKPRHIEFAFNEYGVMTKEIVEPPEDRTERPEVPHALKDGSLDPLSEVLAMRQGVTTWRGFDGKRLYEVHAKPMLSGKTMHVISRDAYGYHLSRTPLSGLTEKEKKTYEKGEPPLTFYLSADTRRIPLGIEVPLYGRVRGTLSRECTTWAECW